MKKLFKETRTNPRTAGTTGLHFIAVLDDEGNSTLHVFDSEDQAGLYHGQLRGYGGVKRIGRLKGSGKLSMDYIIGATAKQFGSKPEVIRHDAASNPVKPRKGETEQNPRSSNSSKQDYVATFKKPSGTVVVDDQNYYGSKSKVTEAAIEDAHRYGWVLMSVQLKKSFKNPVKPRKGEKTKAFVSRCMSEEKEKFPKVKQRIAVCLSKSQARRNPFNDRNLDA